MNTVNNKRNFTGPLILIILFTGVLAGGAILHYINGNLKNAIKSKQQRLIQLQEEIKSYQRERAGKQIIKQEHKRLAGFIPSRENQEEFIWELGKLAQENNLKIGDCIYNSKLLTLKSLPKYQALQCKVTITGSYQDILAFIDSLSRIARLVLVSNLSLKLIPGASNTDPSQFDARLTLDLITSASSVAFSQPGRANLAPSTPAPLLKTTPLPSKLHSTTQRVPPSKKPLLKGPFSTTPFPTLKKPPTPSPVTNGSPFEVKISPVMNPGN
ncbi:MAG: type 4a pilus biogenesis protein PilO [Firmicutes bacterium]|nr:type 4a pilus biogenesis protein PilO [Bacillota bacterium]